MSVRDRTADPVETPSVWLRWAPLPLLGVATFLGWLTSPGLIDADRLRWAAVLTVFLAAGRLAAELLHRRTRPGSVPVLIGWGLHALILVFAVGANPFLCIYAFLGYVDVDRYLTGRLTVVAVVVTGLTCGFGQAGGLPGIRAVPLLFLVLSAVNIALALGMIGIARSQTRAVAAREQMIHELAAAHERNVALHEQLLAQARETGIAEERARLSRELHDTVAQGLVGVIRQLENLPDDLATPVRARIDRADATARDCLTETRRAVRALGPAQLREADLGEAVRDLVERWSRLEGTSAAVRVHGRPLGEADDHVVLRVVQEALSNVGRHAQAGDVVVTLSWLPEALVVDVRDDGVGFDAEQVPYGHGLTGMRDRLSAAGGTLVVESAAGEGTVVVATAPLRVPAHAVRS